MIATLLTLIGLTTTSNVTDSLRTETIDGKTFIIHQVEKKETLFSICKRYGVEIGQVVQNNPGSDSGIDAGQLLKVPYEPIPKNEFYHEVENKQTLFAIAKKYGVSVEELKKWNNLSNESLKSGTKLLIRKDVVASTGIEKSTSAIHTVGKGETLFSIGKKYKVSVDDLVRWNKLSTKELKSGQKLVVAMPVNDEAKLMPAVSKREKQTIKTTEPEKNLEAAPADDKKQAGYAVLTEGSQETRRYLALHRTIPVGTVIRLKNTQNGKEVFVRISGKLETEDADQILSISRAAFERIGGQGRTPVEIVFFE